MPWFLTCFEGYKKHLTFLNNWSKTPFFALLHMEDIFLICMFFVCISDITDIKNIEFSDNYATVFVNETAVATSRDEIGEFTAIGELYSTSQCVYHLEKHGAKWLINSEKIIEETSTLKYGDARYTNIQLNTPKQIGAGKEYTTTLKVDAPKDTVVIASINKENIIYPQEKSEDAFRKMPDDNILERLFTSNKENVNEYAVASIGITRAENYTDNQIRVYMGGLAFIMTRINVIPENKFIKFDEKEAKTDK